MSYTHTDVIFKWSSKDNKGYYSSSYMMNINDKSDKLKYQFYYKNIDNEFTPIIRIDTPTPSTIDNYYSYITNISTIDLQYNKIIRYNNVDIDNILSLSEVRELKLNTILSNE